MKINCVTCGKEKHVPYIQIDKGHKEGRDIVRVVVGHEVPHPNTLEHHIAWMELLFHPDGSGVPYVIGRYDLQAHGASGEGPNTGTVSATTAGPSLRVLSILGPSEICRSRLLRQATRPAQCSL